MAYTRYDLYMKIAQKIKLFFTKSNRRWILLSGLILIGVCFLFPNISPAQASWYDYLNPANWLPALITNLLKLLLLLADNLMKLVIWLVGWTVRNPFGISYTRPGLQAPDNFIIEIGWTLLRDLVNMGFILGLVYIGLATALDFNIKNKFSTGKTFFNLILIALIVNFTPAICGAVVDMGNILGSFFTQSADFQSINTIFERAMHDLQKDWKDILTQGTLLLQTVLLIGFGFGASLILGIYAILFFARGPIIWILVILSPVAFFAYIFDQTRKQFGLWWNTFLQWALMMPVILGFFLYLSQQVLIRANEVMNMTGAGGEGFGGFINRVLPYALPLLFLALGLILGTGKLMPAGGGAIMGVAKAGGIALAGAAGAGVAFAGKKAVGGIKSGVTATQNAWQRKTEGALKPGETGYEQWATKHKVRSGVNKAGRFMFGGESDKEQGDWSASSGIKWARRVARTVGTVATAGAPIWGRRLTRKIGTTIDVNDRTSKEIDEGVEKAKKKTRRQREAGINNALPGFLGRKERLENTIAAIESGDDMKDYKTLTRYKKKEIIEDAFKFVPDKLKTIKNLDPELTAEVANETKTSKRFRKQFGIDMSADDRIKYEGATAKKDADGKDMINSETGEKDLETENGKVKTSKEYKYTDDQGNEKTLIPLAVKILAEIKPNQMNAITSDIAKAAAVSNNEETGGSIINDFWNGSQVSKAAELFGSKFVENFNKNAKTAEWYRDNNQKLGNWIKNQAGGAVGAGFKEPSETVKKATNVLSQEISKLTQEINSLEQQRKDTGSGEEWTRIGNEIAAKKTELDKKQKQTETKQTEAKAEGATEQKPASGSTGQKEEKTAGKTAQEAAGQTPPPKPEPSPEKEKKKESAKKSGTFHGRF